MEPLVYIHFAIDDTKRWRTCLLIFCCLRWASHLAMFTESEKSWSLWRTHWRKYKPPVNRSVLYQYSKDFHISLFLGQYGQRRQQWCHWTDDLFVSCTSGSYHDSCWHFLCGLLLHWKILWYIRFFKLVCGDTCYLWNHISKPDSVNNEKSIFS